VGPCSGDGVWDCVVARPGIGFQGLANIGSTCEASVAADLGEVRKCLCAVQIRSGEALAGSGGLIRGDTPVPARVLTGCLALQLPF
jgi:hypothetical protein